MVKNKSPFWAVETVEEISFDENFNVISFEETFGGKYIKSSPAEIKQMERYGIIDRFRFKDPRYVIKTGTDFKILSTDVYRVKILEEDLLGKKICIYVELYLDKGVLKKMKIRKFIGRKELVSQSQEIEFQI